jgi:DNA-binding NarL/FixJ family response regulator
MLVNAAILRSRLYLAQQRPKEAYDAVAEDFDNFPTQAMHGEYLASRALALAISGEDDRAIATISDARGLTMAVETQVIAACVDALAARDGPQGKRANAAMLATASALETWDGVVVALRAGGEWASEVMSESKYRDRLEGVLALANDYSLARKFGLRVRPITPNGGLSQRELEVLDLIRSGLKNKEIAAALFIGPSTVKTHVDSILAKLGASTRAEAVAVYAEATVDMTGDPTHHPPGGRASGRTSS